MIGAWAEYNEFLAQEQWIENALIACSYIPASEWGNKGKTPFFSSLEDLQKNYPMNRPITKCIKSTNKYANRYAYSFRTEECIEYRYNGTNWYGLIKYTYNPTNELGYYAEHWYITHPEERG